MRKKMLLVVCSVILCISIIGCGASKEKENNSIQSVIEDNSIEEVTETNTIISPLPVTIDINNLDNCTVAVSLEQGDAYVDDTGAMQMDVIVYTYDLYNMVDIASLKEGDVIVIREQELKVTSLEQNDYGTILINGGLECNGFELSNNDSGVWFESGYNDVKSFYEIGKKTIRVSPDFEFYDNSDLDKGEIIYYPGDFLTDDAGIVYHFIPNNTSIVIENGMIIKMFRKYIP